MPLYRIALRLAADQEFARPKKWTTTFYANRVNAGSAAVLGEDMWNTYLRNACRSAVFCYEVYATSAQEGDTDFATEAVGSSGVRGTLTNPGGEPMPIENCLMVPLLVNSSRPDRKFWRVPLFASDFADGEFANATLATAVRTAFQDMITGVVDLRTDDLESFAGVGTPRRSHRRLGRTAGADVPTGPPT